MRYEPERVLMGETWVPEVDHGEEEVNRPLPSSERVRRQLWECSESVLP